MERIGFTAVTGALALASGLALAIAGAADPLILVAGVLAGVGLTLLLWTARMWSEEGTRRSQSDTPPAAAPTPPGPRVEDVLGAVDDPLLLVEGRQVVRANAAAIAALGEHVVDDDVRLAKAIAAAASS